MYILITGIPGSGKTEISKSLKKHFKSFKVLNDKSFCLRNKLGKYEIINGSKEYVVSLPKLNGFLNNYLKTENSNIIFEGHLWAELSLSFLKKQKYIFLLKPSLTLLKKRLKKRNYSSLKIEENLFCEKINYFENLFCEKNINVIKIKVNDNLYENVNILLKKIVL